MTRWRAVEREMSCGSYVCQFARVPDIVVDAHEISGGYLRSPKRKVNGEHGAFISAPEPTLEKRERRMESGFEADRRLNETERQSFTVGAFSEGQRRFLDYHRDNILRLWRRSME